MALTTVRRRQRRTRSWLSRTASVQLLFLGLSITSSWGNGHATTYRSLLKALARRGHSIVFVEKNVEWYAGNRDMPEPEFAAVLLYDAWEEVLPRVLEEAARADAVVIGSFFGDATEARERIADVTDRPLLFYDIDTPITIAALRERGATEYLRADDVRRYDAYMSFTGGPLLDEIEGRFGSPWAVPLYCSVDPEEHRPMAVRAEFEALVSYLGTYAPDRQGKLMGMLDQVARVLPEERFLVAGPMYPEETVWAENVRQMIHVSPRDHAAFYSSCRFTLNLTRRSMVEVGYSPSVRLFEAAACGAAMISDRWTGIESFFRPGAEILLADSTEEMLAILGETSAEEARELGRRARERVLGEHTAERRAKEFERIVREASGRSRG